MIDGVEVAKAFHEAYEQLAPSFGYETRKETRAFDPESANGRLMIAVCTLVGNRIQKEAFDAGFKTGLREGPAAPGEAECSECMNRAASASSIEHEHWCKEGRRLGEEQAALDRRREAEEEGPREQSSDEINQDAGELP